MNDSQQPLNALPQGHRLQEYELLRVLGFGGFGMTYLGFDHNLDKAVAIKEYLPSDIAIRTGGNSVAPQASQFQSDFEWGLDRFLDEARALARFDHRHIIKVYRFFEAHGTAYIVMEYAEGETLSAFLERKGVLTETELKAILYPILDGLEVVHGADFLHRDIKPGNIIIRDEDNSPVLLDFGSARQAIGTRSRSVTSIITPGYAPIEQYSNRSDQGPWTDIYALGGVCYRALTGEVPDDATDRMRDDPLIPVVERCAGQASAEFLSAIDWALAVDEGDRPQSIAEWRARLEGDFAESQGGEIADAEVVRHGEAQERGTVDKTAVRQHKLPLLKRKKTKGKLLAAVICAVALLFVSVVYKINEGGWLSLHTVVLKNSPEMAEVLLSLGADPNLEGTNPNWKNSYGYTPLRQAVRENSPKMVEILLKHGANPNLKGKYGDMLLLHQAVRENSPEMVELLVKYGADLNLKDSIGDRPLHRATEKNAYEIAEVLLNHGADANAKNNSITFNTPLHIAVMYNAYKTAEVLLKYGADVNRQDAASITPLDQAMSKNDNEMVEILRRYGGRR